MSGENVRVLHVVDQLVASSGVASIVMQCITGIAHIRQDVALYGRCDGDMGDVVRDCGGSVYMLPAITQSFGRSFGKAFSRLLQTNEYSIIHGHLVNSAFIYMREAKRAGGSVYGSGRRSVCGSVCGSAGATTGAPRRIIHAHSAASADTLPKRLRNDILSHGLSLWADAFIAVSDEAARNAFARRHVEPDKVTVIYNGIDCERFRFDPAVRAQTRQELGLGGDITCVGCVARFTELKNHKFLLDVFLEMKKKAECVLVLVGEGKTRRAIAKRVADAGVSGSVLFIEARKDIERLYQAFDVFMLPSIREGFGLAALEAQCAGVGCVVSESVPRVIACSVGGGSGGSGGGASGSGNGGSGIQFLPLGDKVQWSDTALAIAGRYRSDGSANVIAAKLDNNSMCDRILTVYESLLGTGSKP